MAVTSSNGHRVLHLIERQVTGAVFERLRSACAFEPRGEVEVKGKGRLRTYLLIGLKRDDAE